MDVHDVGEKYSQLLLQQKRNLERAKGRQGQVPRDWKPKDQLYMGFMMAIMATNSRNQDNHRIHTSFIPPSYLPCRTPLSELRRINIRDLRLETHHRGTYLMVHAITPPNRMTGIMVLVEDEREHAVMLQIYQQDNEKTRAADKIVNVGSVMILKEPFFKVMASGEYGLRIDHVSDIVEVHDYDPRRPMRWRPRVIDAEVSAEILKTRGNEAMGKGMYWQAITQ